MNDEKKLDLQALAKRVAGELPGQWALVPKEEQTWSAEIRNETNGASFWFAHSGYKKKIYVHGDFPRGKNNYSYRPYNQTFEIGVSETSTPAGLAKEIQRRLFPAWLPAFEEAKKRKEATEEQEAKAQAAALQIAAALGSKDIRNDGREAHTGFEDDKPYGHFRCSDQTVDIDLNRVPLEVALKIAELIK